jgi:uncharacterized membrane protein
MRFPGAVRKDIDRWVRKGLIDAQTASRLRTELDEAGGFGLGGVLGVLGALLLGAAIITLVAANWETIPRLVRVIGLIGLMWASWLGGAWRDRAGDAIFSQVLYLIASITFGAAISLIGQMYHLSGDTSSAALVWTVGNLVAAALTRSPVVAAAAAGTGIFYLITAITETSWHSSGYLIVVPLLALALAALGQWNGSRMAKHGAVLLLLATLIIWRFDIFADEIHPIDYLIAFGSAAGFLVCAWFDDIIDSVTGMAAALQGYSLALSFLAFGWIQIVEDGDIGLSIVIGVLVLALAVGALLLKGRENGKVRSLAYTAFGIEILYLAFYTIGSLIGTSAFFLFAGLIVLFIAWLVVRIEKRLKAQGTAT